MKLIDLQPRWIIDGKLFAFLCPHCRQAWLFCKNIPMTSREQRETAEAVYGPEWNMIVVRAEADKCWTISGDFTNLTVTPSIDASRSTHWHGFITHGEIR